MGDRIYKERKGNETAVRSLDLQLRRIRGSVDLNMVEQTQEEVEIRYNFKLNGRNNYGTKR